MHNFVQPGDSLAIAVPYAAGVTAGQGVFDLTKEPSLATIAGARDKTIR